MSKFDARIVARNHKTNTVIDRVKKQAPTVTDRNMVDRVLRPYMHIMNECEIHGVDPAVMYDATNSIAASAFTEMLVRTIPKGNEGMLQATVQSVLSEFTESFLKSVALNFGVTFETAPAGAPTHAGPLTH